MPAYLITEKGDTIDMRADLGLFDPRDMDATIDYIQKILETDGYEIIAAVNAYEGAPAQMYADELALNNGRKPNDKATEIRDANYVAKGIAIPNDAGIFGPVLIFTGIDCLE